MEEIKQGYKHLEIGLIPSDWIIKPIGKLGVFSKGSGISRAESNTGNIPSIRYGEIYTTHNDYIKSFKSYISREIAATAKKLRKGDVLFTASGETKEDIGKSVAFIQDIEAYAGGDIIILSPKDVDSLFLGYLFNAPYVVRQKANKGQGDAVVHITKDSISEIEVAIPHLKAEQTAIATALSDTDALIAALDKKIAKKQQIKQGTMQQLLTGKKRLPGFSGKWVEKTIWEIAEKNKNRLNDGDWIESPYITNEGIRLIQTGNIGIELFKDKTEKKFISVESFDKLNCKEVLPNDILICRLAEPAGRTCLAPKSPCKMITSVDVSIFRPNEEIYDRHFLLYVLNTPNWFSEINDRCGGSTRTRIARMQLGGISILIPQSKSEQIAIAQILTDMDNEIAQLEKERDKYKEIKAGIMQVLLTGKVRLVNTISVSNQNAISYDNKEIAINHNEQINEAVVISFLVNKFSSNTYPLSRFRYTKLAYLLHRKVEHVAAGYKKHAAGPYKSDNRYKGPENIAIKNKYISKVENSKSSKDAFTVNVNIAKALNYFNEWYGTEIQDWIEQFHYYKNDDLEVLTTVDESICDLQKDGKDISISKIKIYIASISQWKQKLSKSCFSDLNIQKMIVKSRELFSD